VPLSELELAEVAANQDRSNKRVNLSQAITTLRQWSDQAETTTVTNGNAVATLQTVVTRLGVFFDRFADLLEVQRLDQ
jgi:pyridoxine/pyridoxamine 5'-phosphate oxidase